MSAAETIAAAIERLDVERKASRREPEDWRFDLHDDETAKLLVTLHRTIDAQLAVLRQGLPYAKSNCLFDDAFELQLARAILGVTS